jgi:hypothetical protein
MFGPAGEVAIIVLSLGLLAWSRLQLRRERGATTVAKTEALALRTAIVSLRPDAVPSVEQALRAPRVPIEVLPARPSSTEGEEEP